MCLCVISLCAFVFSVLCVCLFGFVCVLCAVCDLMIVCACACVVRARV